MENAFAVSIKEHFSGMRTGWTQTARIVRAREWSIRSYSVDKVGDDRRCRADWSVINLLVEQQTTDAKEILQTQFEGGMGI